MTTMQHLHVCSDKVYEYPRVLAAYWENVLGAFEINDRILTDTEDCVFSYLCQKKVFNQYFFESWHREYISFTDFSHS